MNWYHYLLILAYLACAIPPTGWAYAYYQKTNYRTFAQDRPYDAKVACFIGLLPFSLVWCYLLTGRAKHGWSLNFKNHLQQTLSLTEKRCSVINEKSK